MSGTAATVRTWRAGRSDWRLQVLSVFSLAVAFIVTLEGRTRRLEAANAPAALATEPV